MREKAKADEAKRAKEEAALLKPVQTQKVPFGVDPKTVLCAFFKAGQCEKGNKCKFSHDLNVGRKVEKKNLYEDTREEKMKGTSTLVFFGWLILLMAFYVRYDGELGRGEVTICCTFKTWQPEDNYRCNSLALICSS